MLIALLLAALGVDLIVLVAAAAVVLGRKRWVRHQPGVFAGASRAADGELDGLGPKWRRGYGRWARDVLVWTKGPFLFRIHLLPADTMDGEPDALPGEIKRLGHNPLVVSLATDNGRIDLAVRAEDRGPARTPFTAAALEPSAVPSPRPARTVPASPAEGPPDP